MTPCLCHGDWSSCSPCVLSLASTKLQRVVLIAVATFLSLAGLVGACVFLILRFRGLIKYWFHSPPGIPVQIEEVRVRTPVGGVTGGYNQGQTLVRRGGALCRVPSSLIHNSPERRVKV